MTGPYTPTTEEVLEAATGRTRPVFDAQFYRWLVAHEAEVRADEREQAAQRILAADMWPCGECDNASRAVAAARGEETSHE